jgi:hypothetical protein
MFNHSSYSKSMMRGLSCKFFFFAKKGRVPSIPLAARGLPPSTLTVKV